MSQHAHVWIASKRGGEICAGCGAPRKVKPKGALRGPAREGPRWSWLWPWVLGVLLLSGAAPKRAHGGCSTRGMPQ